MLAPKLRFKEFNDEWKKIKLQKLLKFKNGINASKESYGHGVKYISVGDILNNNYITYDNIKGLVDIDENTLNENAVHYGDIVFQRSSETFEDIGQANVYLDKNKIATFGGFVIRGKKISDYDPIFFNYLLKSPLSRKSIIVKGAGAQHYNISQEELEKISLYFPNLYEQQKIGKFLSVLDKKIELQQRKIEVLKMYKKGLLLNECSNKDKNISLEKILKIGKAGGTPKSTNRDYYNGDIPFLSISDMTNQGKYITKTEKKISKSGLENSSAWILPENTLILSMYASYGVVALNKIKLATSQAMFNMILKDNINIEYIYYYLNYLRETHYYDSIVSQGTQPNLNADKVRRMLIYLPSLEEQCKVSKIFINIDKKIDIENKKMEEILKLKNGLLQNMFI